jgi:deoxyribose-phosphate aldolase
VAPLIDHTLLRANADLARIETLCAEAREFGFAGVCVHPMWVPVCAEALRGSTVSVCTVVGFPLGAMRTPIKAAEAEHGRALGAREIDVVMNVGAFKSGELAVVLADLTEVRRATGAGGLLKVILETGFLSDEEKRIACDLAIEAGADYVKTSTGFGPGGATVEDVRLLAERAAGRARVKASGGIRTLGEARALVAAGATRLGTSAGVAIARAEAGSTAGEPGTPGAGRDGSGPRGGASTY